MPSAHGNKQKHESKNPLQRWLISHFHRRLAQLVSELGPQDVLEVGCGEGYVLAALREHGIRCPLSGIDLSPDAVREAALRVPDAVLNVKDARSLADSGASYDLVLMIEVLEHLNEPERMLAVLERIARRYVV